MTLKTIYILTTSECTSSVPTLPPAQTLQVEFQNPQFHSLGELHRHLKLNITKREGTSPKHDPSKTWSASIFYHFRTHPPYHHPSSSHCFLSQDHCKSHLQVPASTFATYNNKSGLLVKSGHVTPLLKAPRASYHI